jgi:hypothetical protein
MGGVEMRGGGVGKGGGGEGGWGPNRSEQGDGVGNVLVIHIAAGLF